MVQKIVVTQGVVSGTLLPWERLSCECVNALSGNHLKKRGTPVETR